MKEDNMASAIPTANPAPARAVPAYKPRTKETGLIKKAYNRAGSTVDSTLAIVDNGVHAGSTFVQSLEPMALEVLNEAKSDLIESIVNLNLARKNAEATLLSAGYTQAEVAEMLNPTK